MHSFAILLAVASSAFAAPVGNNVVSAPIKAIAPIKAVAGVGANVFAPIKAAAANVDAYDINVANKAVTGNKILSTRDSKVVNAPIDVLAPVKAIVGADANVVAPIKAAIANIDAYDINVANKAVTGNKILSTRDNNVVDAPVNAFAPVKAIVGVGANVVAPIKAAVANVDASDINVANKAVTGNKILSTRDNNVVNAPVDVLAPVDALVGVAANVVAPIKAAVANIDASDINVANGALSGNKILATRDNVVDAPIKAIAPVDALVGVAANVVAPVKAAVGNVDLYNVNALEGAVSNNDILKRDNNVANAPVTAVAPVDAVAGVGANVVAPVDAAIANACIDDINVANGALSNNQIL